MDQVSRGKPSIEFIHTAGLSKWKSKFRGSHFLTVDIEGINVREDDTPTEVTVTLEESVEVDDHQS